jgi:translation initiation factor 2 subunit 2
MDTSYEDLLKKAKSNLPKKQSGGRFEIPRPLVQQSGKQTYIRNFSDIAKTLRREPKQIAKYLFKELAIPGAIKGNELVLQAKINSFMIEQRLRDYVKEFVICHECEKPDTNIIEENGITFIKCEACGARRSFRG